ncbi:MAG: glutamate-5-semialdehyde dehydrogenase [Candidatus Omnitrophica bacterium]|nr:glutamate-5-semialdehyde dehydrogenase [Candidatus Omnitrophota bacterium]
MTNWKNNVYIVAEKAKMASFQAQNLTASKKNEFLSHLAEILIQTTDEILKQNEKDVKKCQRLNYSKAFIDRLLLTPERIKKMSLALKNVMNLEDPCGKLIWEVVRPNGLVIKKVRVPIGVIAIIYESRPDVTIEAASLCIKSGNCAILRGGSESISSNMILIACLKQALEKSGISPDVVGLITGGGRRAVNYLLSLDSFIDLVIPRGGESLIRAVIENSKIPVIKHYKGVCHIYIDREADLKMALDVCLNAKAQRPATCNAVETLLVHRDIAGVFIPEMAKVFNQHNVEIRGCSETLKIIPFAKQATEQDWYEEYLDLIISVKVVENIDDAIKHINKYGTRHSDAIITSNKESAEKFLKEVDSACVYHNASTRFTDGGEFGLGAEIGISTDKIHARGPMALEELTTYKYLIYGNGQLRR